MTIDGAKKSRGRPTVDTEAVNVRMSRETLAKLDAWIARQPDVMTRPQAIRAILDGALKEKTPPPKAAFSEH